MFDIILHYIELGELLAIVISIIGLWISIHVWMKDKPILYVEKHSAKFVDDKSVSFIFYLNNIGKQPTTIKEIEICTKSRFIPQTVFSEPLKTSILNTAGHGKNLLTFQPFRLPSQLLPLSSKVIRADLDFGTKEMRDKENNENQLHYRVRIKHTNKKVFERFI